MQPRFVDPWKPKTPGPFRVGDRVLIPFGNTTLEATVVEDRGNLGQGGKRIYGVCYRVDEFTEEVYSEEDADQLVLVARAPEPEGGKKKRKKKSEE